MTDIKRFNRICVLVLDGFGVGELPDAKAFGDVGSNTLAHLYKVRPQLSLPHLEKLGLLKAAGLDSSLPIMSGAAFGKMKEISAGKDTTTGHWEMMGLPVQESFSYFPNGFPKDIMDAFLKRNSLPGYLGNKPASGTEIIKELGEEHLQSGKPIVYTSGDSVFQIACHEEGFELERLYNVCLETRKILSESPFKVGRVIARPFLGTTSESFKRSTNRKDFSLKPFGETCLSKLKAHHFGVIGMGKIPSIYDGEGITESIISKTDDEGIDKLKEVLKSKQDFKGLVFCNLNDLDTLYGHRRNPGGYAQHLEHIDKRLPEILKTLEPNDLLVITSDHGNDPSFKGTDHTREYVPLVMYSPSLKTSIDLNKRESFCDLGQSILDNFEIKGLPNGKSFLPELGA